MPVVQKPCTVPSLVELLPCVVQGLEVSLRCILQDCIVQRQISYQLLQPIVLLLKHLQSLSLLGTDPTVLPTLAVVRVIRDRQFLGYLANRPTLRNQNLSLPQLVDDLLCGVSLSGHLCLPPSFPAPKSIIALDQFLGGRSERVIRIFPNEASAQRLIGALLAEKHETWSTGKKYFDMTEYLETREEEESQEVEEEIQVAS